MEIECVFTCAYCFQENQIAIDASGGVHQRYVEDCQVCCRPNMLVITVDELMQSAEVIVEEPT